MKDPILPNIGEHMRKHRTHMHMSLDELAKLTGLSKSFLSQVERGQTSASIESLGAIAEALQVPMFLFFVEDDDNKVVTRRTEQRQLQVPDSRFQYQTLWYGATRKMEILVGRLQPGEFSSDLPRSHSAGPLVTIEECFFVLSGSVEFYLGEEVHLLEAGESGYFNGGLPHRFRAVGDQELVILFAIVPPALSR